MEVWREPVRGVYGDPAVLAMPGIDRFRRGFAGELVAEGTVVDRGRTMVVSQAWVTTADGALVALADASAALVPLDVRALPLEDAMADGVVPPPTPAGAT